MPATLQLLPEDLRERAFALRPGVPPSRRRIGAEVELIPISADTRLALPIQAEEGLASLPFLRRFGRLYGWKEDAAGKGPRFLLPSGGMLGYDPAWYEAPVALLSGLVHHRESLQAAAELLAPPDTELLRRAGWVELGDAEIGREVRDLFEFGMAGAARLGAAFLQESDLEIAREFFDRYTGRGRCPADDLQLDFTSSPAALAAT